MRLYTNRHKQILKQLKERNDFIVEITSERIENPDAAIPIDFMLESRFNEMKKQAVKIEAEINYCLQQEKENDADYHDHVENLKYRLATIKGGMNENKKFSELIVKLGRANRDFEIVD